ncbi:MAG: oligopeptide transport system ATP-binding protein [Clostridiales bacterium]|jgi:peptide/nickel transport system ATP-binding protein|nr:oligopeptide transport system ATP-binding protein [Clostridiales bacterium]
MERDNILEVKDLKTYFKIREGIVKAVDGVSFELKHGESLGFVGESGCGKTTTALSIIKLLSENGYIESGKILFGGEDLAPLSENEMLSKRWNDISMIFQGSMNALNPVMKVGDQIIEAIRLHEPVDAKEARERVERLFKLVNIDTGLVDSYPHEFSGGMRQRAIIAMALACNPSLIIGDEPTTALDVMVQAQIIDLINDLRQKLNMSMIIITHDLSIISEVCDRVAVMYAGKIVEIGTVEEVIFNYKHPYTEKLIKAFPNIFGEREMVASIPGVPPNLLDPPKGCLFAARCHKKIGDICDRIQPELKEIGAEGHMVACHLWEAN